MADHGEPGMPPDAEQEEREALGKIVFAMRDYRRDAEWEVARWEHNWNQLPPAHKALLANQPAKFQEARRCIFVNQFFLLSMLAPFDPDQNPHAPPHLSHAMAASEEVAGKIQRVPPGDVYKVRYVLKNLMRDWSAEGDAERKESYGRIIDELQLRFADWPRTPDHPPPRVLVPGAGLGRLCLEVAAVGMEVQGNEFSYYMLLAASFMLNHTQEPNQWTIHPFVHQSCNQVSSQDQLRAITIPDVDPATLPAAPGLLSMCAGDFVEVYSNPDLKEGFDAVATCFFIDTAHNIVEYLDIIWQVLAEGGVWVNLGPLLYHWADSTEGDLSVEVPLEEVRRIALAMGFKLVQEQTVDATYIGDQKSMYKTVYQASFWTMIKDSSLRNLPDVSTLAISHPPPPAGPHSTPHSTAGSATADSTVGHVASSGTGPAEVQAGSSAAGGAGGLSHSHEHGSCHGHGHEHGGHCTHHHSGGPDHGHGEHPNTPDCTHDADRGPNRDHSEEGAPDHDMPASG